MLNRRLLLAAVFCSSLAAPVHADPKTHDRLEEVVKDKEGKEMVKVTHIFRHAKGKARPAPSCSCPASDGTGYTFEKVKWFNPIDYTLYTAGSGQGQALGPVILNSFQSWRAAEPLAPEVRATQNDTDAGPGIAYDGVQAIGFGPISDTYGSDTLAVTVYWYSRGKIGGYSKVLHFDMMFNTAYSWSTAAAADSCGGSGAFDVLNVATHEAGHVYGLNHNNDCNLTMNPTASEGETIKSTLAAGDKKGIQALY